MDFSLNIKTTVCLQTSFLLILSPTTQSPNATMLYVRYKRETEIEEVKRDGGRQGKRQMGAIEGGRE